MASLLAKEISIPSKYANFSDVFLKESAAVLLNSLDINKHAIDLEPGKQPPYRPICTLGLVELKIFKTYIKTNLTNKFIWPFKSSAKVSIFFV